MVVEKFLGHESDTYAQLNPSTPILSRVDFTITASLSPWGAATATATTTARAITYTKKKIELVSVSKQLMGFFTTTITTTKK